MNRTVSLSTIAVLALVLLTRHVVAQAGSILEATLAEPNQKTDEVSTEQVRRILVEGTALIVDTRSHTEYAAGHIPGAHLLDSPPSAHVAAVEKLVNGDRSKALVLYCNGPYCGASRRLSDQLVAVGFSNVRRYQLGIPIWRALGGPNRKSGRNSQDFQSRPDSGVH